MSSEIRSSFAARMARVAAREEGLKHIFTTLCNEFKNDDAKKWDAEHMVYVGCIGGANSAQRNTLWTTFQKQMNYVIYNGTDYPVVVDVKEVTEQTDYKDFEKPLREYHFAGEKAVKAGNDCRRAIVEKTMPKKVIFTLKYESGYEEKIEKVVKDKDGNEVSEKRTACFMFTPKTRFGYTKNVLDAFIAALEICAE